MSHFAQVLKQLSIKHVSSTPYRPESQGALECMHQSLKSCLRAYCLEYDKDWGERVHMLMFAVREVVCFSPCDLVFAHTVLGPLKVG